MSKLSQQANGLRSWADQLSEREDEFGVVSRALVADLREAADTITSLRDRLQEVGDQACHATQPNYEHCKYSTNRGWRDDDPFLVWDDTGHLFITMGGLKTWDVTDNAKTWFATLGGGECELHECEGSFSAVNRPVWRCDCGAFMTQYTDATTYHKPRYCPNCGREVVDA